jgi:hypothetical protein
MMDDWIFFAILIPVSSSLHFLAIPGYVRKWLVNNLFIIASLNHTELLEGIRNCSCGHFFGKS